MKTGATLSLALRMASPYLLVVSFAQFICFLRNGKVILSHGLATF